MPGWAVSLDPEQGKEYALGREVKFEEEQVFLGTGSMQPESNSMLSLCLERKIHHPYTGIQVPAKYDIAHRMEHCLPVTPVILAPRFSSQRRLGPERATRDVSHQNKLSLRVRILTHNNTDENLTCDIMSRLLM